MKTRHEILEYANLNGVRIKHRVSNLDSLLNAVFLDETCLDDLEFAVRECIRRKIKWVVLI